MRDVCVVRVSSDLDVAGSRMVSKNHPKCNEIDQWNVGKESIWHIGRKYSLAVL